MLLIAWFPMIIIFFPRGLEDAGKKGCLFCTSYLLVDPFALSLFSSPKHVVLKYGKEASIVGKVKNLNANGFVSTSVDRLYTMGNLINCPVPPMPCLPYWISIPIVCLMDRCKILRTGYLELEAIPDSLESYTIPKEMEADGQDSRARGGCGIE